MVFPKASQAGGGGGCFLNDFCLSLFYSWSQRQKAVFYLLSHTACERNGCLCQACYINQNPRPSLPTDKLSTAPKGEESSHSVTVMRHGLLQLEISSPRSRWVLVFLSLCGHSPRGACQSGATLPQLAPYQSQGRRGVQTSVTGIYGTQGFTRA